MIAVWIAFAVLGLLVVIYVLSTSARLVRNLRLINSLTVDTYNVYVSNQNKCDFWKCTEKALKRDKIALNRAINAEKRSMKEIREVCYSFVTPVPKSMSVSRFYHHIRPKFSRIHNWSYTVGHNIKLYCRYYYTEGDSL